MSVTASPKVNYAITSRTPWDNSDTLDEAYLVPGQCNNDTINHWSKKACCKGWSGYHGANLECTIWEPKEANLKLEEIEKISNGRVPNVMFCVEASYGLRLEAERRGWQLVELFPEGMPE